MSSLKPQPDPIKVNIGQMMVMAFIFALVFALIGVFTRHYVTLHSVGV